MIEADAPILFTLAFLFVIVCFVILIVTLYRRKYLIKKSSVALFLIYWAFTTLAFFSTYLRFATSSEFWRDADGKYYIYDRLGWDLLGNKRHIFGRGSGQCPRSNSRIEKERGIRASKRMRFSCIPWAVWFN